jgi:flagellar basal body P-ring protein FlgI
MKSLSLLAAAPLLVAGCFSLNSLSTVARPQIEDAPPASRDQAKLVGQISEYENASDLVVYGYGLVTGLDGTGGPTPAGDARVTIVDRLKKNKIENVSEIIDSPDSAIVIVTGVVKPGVRRDELVDVEVTLPPGSKVKSLRGGILQPTPLKTYTSQNDVRSYLKDNGLNPTSEGNRMLGGHDVVIAKGPLQTALIEEANTEKTPSNQPVKRAFVWKGGKLLEGRAMFLVLNTDSQRFRIAEQIANRINETFHGGDTPTTKLASAMHKDLVAITVPPRYRLNHPHYLRVVRAIPINTPRDSDASLHQLNELLLTPETAARGAIGLEAIGEQGMPMLKAALKNENPLVRFHAAESLAYLGQPIAGEALARTATEHPALQAYALTALAALDDAVSIVKLEELLGAREAALRYGAFRALREVDPNSAVVQGEWAGRSYVIHEGATVGTSMIHMLSQGRSEFVLFGEAPKLTAPFSLTAGPEITITARPGDSVVTISKFTLSGESPPVHIQSTMAVADVLKKMAELGGTYADAAEMLNKASEQRALTCKLAKDALPRAVPIKKLAEAAREDPRLEQEYDLLTETENDELTADIRPSLKETKTPERSERPRD